SGNKGLKNPLKGRPRTKFDSMEEELEYYKAQVAYLKKQYPNL
ncbi:transposase, partial [Bacillus cereus]|nr:transposase [Bacillus cereus]